MEEKREFKAKPIDQEKLKKYLDNFEVSDEAQENENRGILPDDRDLKKNLGCGL
ncbi:MAG: hypothetical protein AAFX87_29700 [Bacteroidota bacterium]